MDTLLAWTEQIYSGQMVKVKNNETGVYPIDDKQQPRYDIYRKTPYTDYKPSDEPITNPGYMEDDRNLSVIL